MGCITTLPHFAARVRMLVRPKLAAGPHPTGGLYSEVQLSGETELARIIHEPLREAARRCQRGSPG